MTTSKKSKRKGNHAPGQRVANPESERSVSKARNGKTLAIFVKLDLPTRIALERLGRHYDMKFGHVVCALINEADRMRKGGKAPKVAA